MRTQPRHERIAAVHLRQRAQIEVFVPRIRFRRPGSKGLVWATEALFPSYFFARFRRNEWSRLVHHTAGVSGVVHFGLFWPTIPDGVIEHLRGALGEAEVREVPAAVSPGDEVKIAGGTFHGLEGVIAQVMPGRQRVAVLMEFLGRQTAVEVNVAAVVKAEDSRRGLLRGQDVD